jgi:hypothetical protein
MVKKPRVSTRKYKKCILSTIRGTKIKTPKSAQQAFFKAARKCKHFLGLEVKPKKKKSKRKPRSVIARSAIARRMRPNIIDWV